MQKILVIAGPTAVGKTALSIKLAKQFNGEIISGDSMQVYRGLDIGTAKVTHEEMNEIPHFLIDIKAMDDSFTVAEFKALAEEKINAIANRGHLPIIVGGTGFYLQALIENLELGGSEVSDFEKKQLRTKLQSMSDEEIKSQLKKVDLTGYNKLIKQDNMRRIRRALEVYRLSGSSIFNQPQNPIKFNTKIIGLNTTRSLLYERINDRVNQMIQMGLESEAKKLMQIPGNLQAKRGIGYREWETYFKNQQTYEQVIEQIKQDSRRYAKRQLTWFRNKMDVSWYDLIQDQTALQKINNEVEEWLKDELEN